VDADAAAPQGNREARYRVERNEARAALDAANTRIEAMNRREVERIAGETLAMAGDLWISGNDVASYLNDAGEVDIDRVREDARILIQERPGLGKYQPAVDMTQGHVGNPGKGTPTFADLLK
jgi:hypothetical protein